MERQFAVLDSLGARVRAEGDGLQDLQVVAVLDHNRRERVNAMVGAVTLPVLWDTEDEDFRELYGASKHKCFFFFDAERCLHEAGFDANLEQRAGRLALYNKVHEVLGAGSRASGAAGNASAGRPAAAG